MDRIGLRGEEGREDGGARSKGRGPSRRRGGPLTTGASLAERRPATGRVAIEPVQIGRAIPADARLGEGRPLGVLGQVALELTATVLAARPLDLTLELSQQLLLAIHVIPPDLDAPSRPDRARRGRPGSPRMRISGRLVGHAVACQSCSARDSVPYGDFTVESDRPMMSSYTRSIRSRTGAGPQWDSSKARADAR